MADTVYARAAELIRTRGWRQGPAAPATSPADSGCLCLMDAVIVAQGGDPRARWSIAAEAVWQRLGALLVRQGACGMPMFWNDADGRTVDDVLALLAEADR